MATEGFKQITEYPVINNVPVKSLADSQEQIAEVFGHVAKAAANQATDLVKAQKDAQFLHESNRLLEITNKAKADMETNPAQAATISRNAQALANQVVEVYNEKDREKLRTVFDQHVGSMNITAARLNHHQAKLRAGVSWDDEFPTMMEDLRKTKDPEEFHKKALNILSTNNELFFGGAINDKKRETNQLLINMIQKQHERELNHLANGDHSAESVTYFGGHSFTNDATNAQYQPSNQHTNEIAQHYEVELSAKAAYADADNAIYPEQITSGKLSLPEVQQAMFRYDGATKGQALVNSNQHYPYLQYRIKELQASESRSYGETGELNFLNEWNKKLDNGQSMELMLNTNSGSRIYHGYLQKRAAIEGTVFSGATPEESEAKKMKALNDNDIDMMHNMQSLMIASEIPGEKMNLLMPDKVIPIKNSFTQGADVTPAINTLYSLPRNMQYWAAKPLDKPEQKAAMYGAAGIRLSLPDDVVAPEDSFNLVRAAQDKKDYSLLKLGENNEKEATIRKLVTSRMSDITNYVSLVPEGNQATGGQWNSGIVSLGVNYVKDQMIANNDYEGRNIYKYTEDYKRVYGKGFKILQGGSYTYNMNEVSFTPQEGAAIAYSKLMDVYNTAKEHASEARVMNAMDILHLHVVNTRDGSIAVVDPTGRVVSPPELVTPKMIAHAVHSMKENQKLVADEINKEIGEQNPLGTPPAYAPLGIR